MKKTAPLTQSEYAKYKGWSKQYVSKLVKRGTLELNEAGKIDVAAADERLEKNLLPKRGNGKGRKPASYVAALERHTQAKAALTELELKIKTGQYISKESVYAGEFKAAHTIRDSILNIPDRISGIVLSMAKTGADEREIHAFLTKEFTEALRALAGLLDPYRDQSQEGKNEDAEKTNSNSHA
jgi:phage terminase Nu1 subunit (DNA packaging protein)